MPENEFALKSNADVSVSQQEAAAAIEKVAGAPAPLPGSPDAKVVTDKGLRKEFDLNTNEDREKEPGEPEKETDVETDEPETKKEPAAKKEAEATPSDTDEDTGEAIADWLKEVDLETRQDILDEFVDTNIDDLVVNVMQAGQDVELTIKELKRQAAGYTGESNAGAKQKELKADIKRREDAIGAREKFLTDQFADPTQLMTFLDANVEEPEKYFKAVKEHADAVLAEAEDNPAQFRRNAALRRENVELRNQLTSIDTKLDRIAGNGSRDTDASGEEADADTHAQLVKEGQRRYQLVADAGLDKAGVEKAWKAAGEPEDVGFDRWLLLWSRKQAKETSDTAKETTTRNRRRGGGTLRRRGNTKSTPAAEKPQKGHLPDATEIGDYLRQHPSNKGRMA